MARAADILIQLPEPLVDAAIVNQPEGSEDVAWRRAGALEVLRYLAPSEVAVLGGAVLVRDARGFRHTYDNWSCDHELGEGWSDYAVRSRNEAQRYIARYLERGEVAYVLVFRERPSARDLLLSKGVDAGA
jgi:hypothetical protein